MGLPGPDRATTEDGDVRRAGALNSSFRGRAPISPLRSLRAHPLIVAAIILATVAGGVAWLTLHSPSYRAKAEVLITPLEADDPDRMTLPLLQESRGDPIRTVQTAAELIDSQQAAELAARRLGGDWTAKAVRNAIDVEPKGQTNILDITAVGESPEQAVRLANVFAGAVIDSRARRLRPRLESAIESTRAQLEQLGADAGPRRRLESRLVRLQALRGGDPTVELSQEAADAERATGLAPPLVVALTLLAGGLLAVGLVPLIDMLGPRKILTEEELLAVYPLPVLARIPALPSRRRTKPPRLELDPSVWEAFRTIQVQLELMRDECPVIMFTSPSPGDGKTSSAIDFSLQLAGTDSDVVLIDLDLRKPDLAMRMGVTSSAPAPPAADGDADNVAAALRVVPGHPRISLLEARSLPGLGGGFKDATEHFARVLRRIRLEADYVIVDVPPLGEVSDPLLFVSAVTDIILVARVGNSRYAAAEIARDLLLRADRLPTGYLVIGGDNPVSNYGYYAPQRSLQRDETGA